MSKTTTVECPQCGNTIVAETVTLTNERGDYSKRYARSGTRSEDNHVGGFCLSTVLFSILSFVLVFLVGVFFHGIDVLIYDNANPNIVVFLLYQFVLPIILAVVFTNILFGAFHIKVNWSGRPVIRCKQCGFGLGGFHG